MKTSKLLLLAALLISANYSFAQNYIALEHADSVSLYNNLAAAASNAQHGDNIYIPGGTFNIGTVTIDKRVHIYGVGHYTDSTSATGPSQLIGTLKFIDGADSGSVSGFYLSGDIYFGSAASNQDVENFSITRCNINYLYLAYTSSSTATTSTNFYISENVIRGDIYGSNAQNCLFEKNIIEGYIKRFSGNAVFRNNILLFIDSGTFASGVIGTENYLVSYCVFENNIIFGDRPLQYYAGNYQYGYCTSYCTFNNNVFIYNQNFPFGTNIGNNNTVNQAQSSIFVSQSGTSFSYSHNYHLKSTSPGKNAGTDGTDIGIYGTANPYKEGAVPITPHILFKSISSQTDNNGFLNVNIKVSAQDN